MAEMMNDARARWAQVAVTAFAEQTGAEDDPDVNGAPLMDVANEALCDLFVDLLHLALARGIHVPALLEHTYEYYRAEFAEEDDMPYREWTDGQEDDERIDKWLDVKNLQVHVIELANGVTCDVWFADGSSDMPLGTTTVEGVF